MYLSSFPAKFVKGGFLVSAQTSESYVGCIKWCFLTTLMSEHAVPFPFEVCFTSQGRKVLNY